MTRDPPWVGISRHGSGFRAAVSRGKHLPKVYRFFPAGTDPAAMQEWRADERARHRLTRKTRASYGTFEGDARRYLRSVTALPTHAERTRHIEHWIGVFGTRRRDTIGPADIRAERDRLLITPRSSTDARPLSSATVNRYLRALSNVWTVLDGRREPNPVRDVPEAHEPTLPPRVLTVADIRRILDAMPDRGFRPKGSNPKRHGDTPSLSKARIAVLAWTGWPASVLQRMTADRLDLTQAIAHLPARTKGRGAPAVSVPLTPEAVSALQHLAAVGGFGRFSVSLLGRSFRRACRRVQLSGVRVYDLRHAFLSRLAFASKDERAVQAVAQHGSLVTTRRYTRASVDPRIAAAVAALTAWDDLAGRPERRTAKNAEENRSQKVGPRDGAKGARS